MHHLRVRNWERYQHYKERNPPWIKLYVELLDEECLAAFRTRQAARLCA